MLASVAQPKAALVRHLARAVRWRGMATPVSKIVEVSSSIFAGGCPICHAWPKSVAAGDESISPRVNHLLEHGLILLHVGQQTTNDLDGRPWHSTVAVLGRPS
jgi:hypothetical protein